MFKKRSSIKRKFGEKKKVNKRKLYAQGLVSAKDRQLLKEIRKKGVQDGASLDFMHP